MLLVGSKALQAYLPLNRVIHDWDIWMSDYEYFEEILPRYKDFLVKENNKCSIFDIHGDIYEIKYCTKFDPTDRKVWEKGLMSNDKVNTPIGIARVPDIQTIYDMKKATALCIDEWKHKYDLELIEKHYCDRIESETELFKNRLQETRERVEKSKKNKFGFFHKNALFDQKIATIPEYVEHDYLHDIIADLVNIEMPTYKRITTGDYKISEEQFNRLTYAQKISLMVEETLVLCLERWFIPQMVENGINYKLLDKFYDNNEASPTYMLLKHVNIKGLIGEAEYITGFARQNFNIIEKSFFHAKHIIKMNKGFPMHLYDRIFDLRERYKKGEKVGLHHETK